MTKNNNEDWRNNEALRKYQLIAPIISPELDKYERANERRRICETMGVPERTLFRYELEYRTGGFEGLKPKTREKRISNLLPKNFKELVDEAIILKREIPSRSIPTIIRILELEDRVSPGVLKQSTLRRYLYDAGFGKKQLKKHTEAQKSSSKRFCKPHRMMLVQGDVKYGPLLPIGKNGKLAKTYLSSVIDDHSRLVLASQFYDNEGEDVIIDTVHKAILKYGKPDAFYFDNGAGYISKHLLKSLLSLGVKVLHTKPYAAASKGKIEKFNDTVNKFIEEAKVKKFKTLEEMNVYWSYFLDDYYHDKPHEGIKEYYASQGTEFPEKGITPREEWMRDSRSLVFLDAATVGDAFIRQTTREVDKGACISLFGKKYEVNISLIGATVTVYYDPLDLNTITVSYAGIVPFKAHPIKIGSYCDAKPEIPQSLLPIEPETSRFLDALAKKHTEKITKRANAISFTAFNEQGGGK